jgi:biopolymer transport protein ExbD
MNLSGSRTQDEPEIGMVPLIDVVLTLIIFFVVTTTFEDRAALKVSLPEASVAPTEAPREPLLIVVDEKGTYYVGGNEVLKPEAADLRAAVEKVAGNDRERQVLLRADARAPWQAGVTAMDVLGQLGFENVSIATVQAGETPP